MAKFLALLIVALLNPLVCNSHEVIIKTESSSLLDFSYQNPPFYFLNNIPASVKVFSGIDLSFFRDKSKVERYRFRLEIPEAGGTRIDRTLTRWSPWLKFDFTEVVIPVLDIEGGYRFIIEYEDSNTKELLRFERAFYVFRLIVGYSGDAVPQPVVQNQSDKNQQPSSSGQKPAPKVTVSANSNSSVGEISRADVRRNAVAVLAKLEIDPQEIEILKLVQKSTSQKPVIGNNISLAEVSEDTEIEDASRFESGEEITTEINSPEDVWNTGSGNPLSEAMEKNDVELFKKSITEGSVSGLRGGEGGNIFHLLNDLYSDEEVLDKLIDIGISLDETDNNGNSPLHLAILTRQNNYAMLLINKGADLNLINKLGLSPLHIASILDNRAVAGALMINGADINIRGNTGYTPLHIAAELNYPGLAGDLIQMGANPRLKTHQGLNSKNIANIQKSRELSQIISGKSNNLYEDFESSSMQLTSYIGTKVLSPKFEFILPYDEALVRKRQSSKIVKIISVPVLALGSTGFLLLKSRADFFYSSYLEAESIEIARRFYDKTIKFDTFSYVAGGVSVFSLYGIIHSMIRKKSIENRMFKVFY